MFIGLKIKDIDKTLLVDCITESLSECTDINLQRLKQITKDDIIEMEVDSLEETYIVVRVLNGMYTIMGKYTGEDYYKDTIKENRYKDLLRENKIIAKIDPRLYIKTDKKFKDEIDEKYNIWINKTNILGIKHNISYKVIGKEVVLTGYTGEGSKAILPGFITCIKNEALIWESDIETIQLPNNLKRIGNWAFQDCNIKTIEIPASVEVIMKGAFIGNNKLFKYGKLDIENRVIINSGNTIVLEQDE